MARRTALPPERVPSQQVQSQCTWSTSGVDVMPELTIRLRCDPGTGKKDIIIGMRSDEAALPHEHEEQHRALVEKLIGSGLVQASEVGKIVVEREEEKPLAAPAKSEDADEKKAVA